MIRKTKSQNTKKGSSDVFGLKQDSLSPKLPKNSRFPKTTFLRFAGRCGKYKAIKTKVDGIVFDSKREAKRYSDLKLFEKIGTISELQLQVVYLIEINGVKICKYVADFVYIENGKKIVEDCKGFKTRDYRLKNKLMKAVHGIEIREI